MSKRQYGKWSSALSKVLTLDERIQFLRVSGRKRISARKIASAKKVIKAWKGRKPFSEGTGYKRRLNDLGVDEDALCLAIALPVTHVIRRYVSKKQIWEDFAVLAKSVSGDILCAEKHGHDAGFAQLVQPLINQSLKRFRLVAEQIMQRDVCGILELEHVCKQVELDLIKRAGEIVQKTCLLEMRVAKLHGQLAGNSSIDRYASYIKLLGKPSYARQLFLEYPVLLGIVSSRLSMYCENTISFLNNLVNDSAQIADIIFSGGAPGKVQDWKAGAGDSHCGGKSVITVNFIDGKRLIYKPRSLGVDLGFNKLVKWCNEKVPGRPLRAIKTINLGTHGWCEYIEHRELESETEITDFFYRQGKFIALFYALQANDLHYENMIACGADPVYVDLETLFHTPPAVNAMMDVIDSIVTPATTVLDTFILPLGRLASEDKSYIDISIFGADPSQQLPPSLSEAESGTDEAHLRARAGKLGASSHLLQFKGTVVSPENYAAEICAGFIAFYQLFEQKSQFLQTLLPVFFSGAEIRHLARTTGSYSAILDKSLHPDYLGNELERTALFERLFSNIRDNEWLNKLLDSEIRDMRELDVPYFYRHFDQHKIFDSRGTEIPNLQLASPQSIVSHHLSRLCESDMSAQLRLIDLSLTPASGFDEPCHARTPAIFRQSEVTHSSVDEINESIVIAEGLRDSVVCSGGDSYWLCQTIRGNSLVVTSPNIIDLYDGQLGIALFLGILSAVTGIDHYKFLCLSSLETVRRWTRSGRSGFSSCGVYNGSMGYAYVFANLGICLELNYLLDEAFDWIAGFDPEREKDCLDIIGGAAGCILFLSNLLNHSESRGKRKSDILRLINFFAERIMSEARREIVGVSWRTPVKTDRALTGFAHGNAGFAASLFVSASIFSSEKYRELGYAAISFENQYYSKKHGGWMDLAEDSEMPSASNVKCSWCRGVSGILLSRLIAIESMGHTDELRHILMSDIARGTEVAVIKEHSKNSSLCHGFLGDNEIFKMAGRALPKAHWESMYAKFGSHSDPLHRRCGDLGRNPVGGRLAAQGLMVGNAGVGYGLLRHASPETVPSVLRLGLAN